MFKKLFLFTVLLGAVAVLGQGLVKQVSASTTYEILPKVCSYNAERDYYSNCQGDLKMLEFKIKYRLAPLWKNMRKIHTNKKQYRALLGEIIKVIEEKKSWD